MWGDPERKDATKVHRPQLHTGTGARYTRLGRIGTRNLSFHEGDAPLDAALAKPCRFHVAWVGHSDHPAEHLEARGTDIGSVRGR